MQGTIEQFQKLVDEHDLTYSYSDDHRCWQRGQSQRDAIAAMAKTLPRADVVRVWNAKVDRSLMPQFREPFYWKENNSADAQRA